MTKEIVRMLPTAKGFLFHAATDERDLTDTATGAREAIERAFDFHNGRTEADPAHFHEAVLVETEGGYIVLRSSPGGVREIICVIPYGADAIKQVTAQIYKAMLECDHAEGPKKPGPLGIVN